jgi:hypothetical protein
MHERVAPAAERCDRLSLLMKLQLPERRLFHAKASLASGRASVTCRSNAQSA